MLGRYVALPYIAAAESLWRIALLCHCRVFALLNFAPPPLCSDCLSYAIAGSAHNLASLCRRFAMPLFAIHCRRVRAKHCFAFASLRTHRTAMPLLHTVALCLAVAVHSFAFTTSPCRCGASHFNALPLRRGAVCLGTTLCLCWVFAGDRRACRNIALALLTALGPCSLRNAMPLPNNARYISAFASTRGLRIAKPLLGFATQHFAFASSCLAYWAGQCPCGSVPGESAPLLENASMHNSQLCRRFVCTASRPAALSQCQSFVVLSLTVTESRPMWRVAIRRLRAGAAYL